MRPKVVMHTQVSLDGCVRGFENPAAYYMAAEKIGADAVLFGSETVVQALRDYPEDAEPFARPASAPHDARPWGVIADSRGRVRKLRAVRGMGYLRDVIALASAATPREHLEYLERTGAACVVAGEDHVDYAAAFEALHERYGCRVLRTDSGGVLTSELLARGLVDEISLVLSPCLVGNRVETAFRSLRLPQNIPLELVSHETVLGQYLSVVYRVPRP